MGEKKEVKIKFKDLSMKQIFTRAPLYSLIFNVIYLFFESLCVFAINMPLIHLRMAGGECDQYVGFYWLVTRIYPMTDSSVGSPGVSTDREFSILRFFLSVMVIAVIILLVMMILNGYKRLILTLFISIAVLIAVIAAARFGINKYNDIPTQLESVLVVTSDLHPGVYNAMYYPEYAAKLIAPGEKDNVYGYSKGTYLRANDKNLILPEDVSAKQLKKLLKATEAVRESKRGSSSDGFAYIIIVRYKTKGGREGLRTKGYGAFPEEWAEFVRVLNETCGTDYLREDPKFVPFSYEWFSETYGITEKDLPEGATIEEFIDYKDRNSMERLCGLNYQYEFAPYDPTMYLEWFKNGE